MCTPVFGFYPRAGSTWHGQTILRRSRYLRISPMRRRLAHRPRLDMSPQPPSGTIHDDTLIDWFLSLEPLQRLAELESRVAFFNAARRDGDTELSSNIRAIR
jgi:hypothetical protein